MFIIWGWRVRQAVLGGGRFYCPECRSDTDYRHLALRHWFTLFFIPIIPLKRLGTVVECSRCQMTFTERALEVTTLEVFEHHQGLANRAAVAHLVSRSVPVDDDTLALGLQALASAPGVRSDFDRDALTADLSFFADLDVVMQYLRPMAAEMTVEGREDFLRRLLVLDGHLPHATPDVDRTIEQVAAALAMSPAHLAGIEQLVRSGTATAEGEL